MEFDCLTLGLLNWNDQVRKTRRREVHETNRPTISPYG